MGLVKDFQPVSNYFKNTDIVGGEVVMTIIDVVETTYPAGLYGPERTEPALKLEETEKLFGLNKTNREKLAELFGSPEPTTGCMDVDTESLLGQKIALYKATTQNKQGATVPCVRIRAPRVANAAPARAPLPAARQAQRLAQPAPRQQAAAAPNRQPVPRQGPVPQRAPAPQPQQQPDNYPEPGSYDGDDLSNAPDGTF